jgi:hypothetical protein
MSVHPRALEGHDADQILLEARAGSGVSNDSIRASIDDAGGGFSDPDETGGHNRVSGEGTTRWVDVDVIG